MTSSSARIETSGAPLTRAKAAMILLHGRGATAAGMLELGEVFAQPDVAYIAPQAPGNTWYPHDMMLVPRTPKRGTARLPNLAQSVVNSR